MKIFLTYLLLILAAVMGVYFIYFSQIILPWPSWPLVDLPIFKSLKINQLPKSGRVEEILSVNLPLDKVWERIVKKPFGLRVAPDNSPVSPEKFSGYHTGVDFEIFSEEENAEVEVRAICNGELVYKIGVNGYGGVAIQSCELENQKVTVLYGHLDLASIGLSVGQTLTTGQTIGILGQGYSSETDGERKHLHLSVHLGNQIILAGYVSKQSQLADWLNPLNYLPVESK